MNEITALIFSLGGLATAVIVSQMWQNNWIKRETFKLKKRNILAENRIKMKKLERELGLGKYKNEPEPSSNTPVEGISNLLNIAKELEPEQLRAIVGKLTGEPTEADLEEEGEDGISEGLMQFARENPEMVKNIIANLSGKKEESGW